MGKPRKSKSKNDGGKPAPGSSDKQNGPGSASSRPGGRRRRTWRSWYAANRTDLRFLLVFAVSLGLFYLATLTTPVRDGFFPAYLRLNARISGAMLGVIGEDVTVDDQALISADGPSIQIERGCDAVEPSALFVSAVLASPVPIVSRLLAAAGGTILLMMLNLIRVVSLFLVRLYYPKAFETMHLDVWQALFIFLAILLWALWAARMSQKRTVQQDAST